MKKTARIIITFKCDRHCPGCCNEKPLHGMYLMNDIRYLRKYKEIVITGGEPFLNPGKLLWFVKELRKQNSTVKIYLYTANLRWDKYTEILKELDGITVTFHAEATDKDIYDLKRLSSKLPTQSNYFLNTRLFIDTRVYDKYDLSNINLQGWDIIRKLTWKEECPPAPNEDLVFYSLF